MPEKGITFFFLYKIATGPEPTQHSKSEFNPLNAELNPICHLLELLEAHHIFHVSGPTFNMCTAFGCKQICT